MPPHPTFYVRRSVYEQHGSFDTSFRIAADYDCMLRFLGLAKVKCTCIPQVMVKMRLGGASNRSVSNIIRKSKRTTGRCIIMVLVGCGCCSGKTWASCRSLLRSSELEAAITGIATNEHGLCNDKYLNNGEYWSLGVVSMGKRCFWGRGYAASEPHILPDRFGLVARIEENKVFADG